jgi:hypothetical protein
MKIIKIKIDLFSSGGPYASLYYVYLWAEVLDAGIIFMHFYFRFLLLLCLLL